MTDGQHRQLITCQQISVVAITTHHYRNGTLLRTSGTPPTAYPYVLGVELQSVGAAFNAAQISVGSGSGAPLVRTTALTWVIEVGQDATTRQAPALAIL